MRYLKIVIFLLFYLLTLDVNAVKVVFRFDDPILSPDSTTMKVLNIFNENEIPLVVAVIPCDSLANPYEATDSIYLNQFYKKNIEVAMHGFNHLGMNQYCEFSDLDSIETNQRISLGKLVLDSQLQKDIIVFIPPCNSINQYIPNAILTNGMYILSSNMYDFAYASNIQYFPETLDRDLDKKGFVTAAKEAIDNALDTEICVLMFHVYDFKEEASWKRLEHLLNYCRINPNVELHTFRSLYESGERSTYHRYRANQLRSGLQKCFLHKGVLHTTRLCWFVHILNALLYALIPLLLLIGIGKMCSYYRNTIYAIVAFGCVAFFMLAFFNVLGSLKLLGVDILFVLCTLILTHSIYRICIKK